MNRWNTRNTLNKRDVLALKRELENIKQLLIDVEQVITQQNAQTVTEIKTELNQGQQLLQDSNKNAREDSAIIMDKVLEVFQICQNNNCKCSDLEELMKMLLMDSLVREVNNGKEG